MTELCKSFYFNLNDKYGISKNEFDNMDFKCCGIFKPDKKLDKNTKLLPTYINYFNNTFHIFFSNKEKEKLKDRFIYKKKCVCGQRITTNCFIYSRQEDILLNIGVCCNLKFNENGNKKFCVYCNVEHNNRKNNICNDCRDIYKQCIKCGEYKKDKYEMCSKCKFNKIYDCCQYCDKKKIPNTYLYCYDCNMKKKYNKHFKTY